MAIKLQTKSALTKGAIHGLAYTDHSVKPQWVIFIAPLYTLYKDDLSTLHW